MSCNIIDSFFNLWCYGWKLDFGGMIGSSVELSFVLCCNCSVVVHDIFLTTVLSIITGYTVALGMWTLLYAVLSIDT